MDAGNAGEGKKEAERSHGASTTTDVESEVQEATMTPTVNDTCRNLLSRLAVQIQTHLPALDDHGRMTSPAVPLERLPTLAECVRVYVETEAILAGAQPLPDGQCAD